MILGFPLSDACSDISYRDACPIGVLRTAYCQGRTRMSFLRRGVTRSRQHTRDRGCAGARLREGGIEEAEKEESKIVKRKG